MAASRRPNEKEIVSGGYSVELVEPFPKDFSCYFCHLLIKHAVQTFRGERACETCYREAKGNSNVCPIDGEPIDDVQVFSDRFARRQIENLLCYCRHKGSGCDWKGTVKEFELHETKCEYNDYVTLQTQNETNGFKRVREQVMECPYVCGQNVVLNDLYGHVGICQTLAIGTTCPFSVVGCLHKPISPSDLYEHLQKDMNIHAAMTVTNISNLKEQNDKMKDELVNEQVLRKELKRQIHDSEVRSMAEQLNKLKGDVAQITEKQKELKEAFDEKAKTAEELSTKIDTMVASNSIEQMHGKLDEMSEMYERVEKNAQKDTQSTTKNSSSSPEMKNALQNVDRLESNNAVLSANISDLDLKLQLLENTTYDGRQIWKVDNVCFRRSQATLGQVTALHSAPCFQIRGGYKFCCRLYLNGDGMGRGTHISLFFVIMKSEYDALLQWPFSERVTFRLVNPYDINGSKVESFVPDPNSSSFRQPKKDMNVAAGCPMFMRQDELDKFIVNDIIYIESSIKPDVTTSKSNNGNNDLQLKLQELGR